MTDKKVYGYLRISTISQNIDNNKANILKLANKLGLGCVEWIEETKSGTIHFSKRKLGELINKCNKGDSILTSELSRVGRCIAHISQFCQLCIEKGVNLHFTTTDLKIDNSIESQILQFSYALAANIEHQLIVSRTRTALAAAKARGVKLGRKSLIDKPESSKLYKYTEEIKKLREVKSNKAYMAKKFGVSISTMYNFLKRLDID